MKKLPTIVMPLLLIITVILQIFLPKEIVQTQEVRALPGKLDEVPIFNSNSPEIIENEGILLSTFSPQGRKVAGAHLNFAFQGRFDIFAHHFSPPSEDGRSLYFGIILHNASTKTIKVEILQGASYLVQPDAPYNDDIPAWIENPKGDIYAGPGDRTMNDNLRGKRQENLPEILEIPAKKTVILLNLPIPVKKKIEYLGNGRSTLLRLRSNGPVYAASLAMYAEKDAKNIDRPPSIEAWQNLLNNGNLVTPRDKSPTPLDQNNGQLIYGRVAGVTQGSQWQAKLLDTPKSKYLTIPQRGQAFSYTLSTVYRGTLGTGIVQSARILRRYPDTAYQAHGNYGVQYNLILPLYNPTKQTQIVSLSIQTPIKEDYLDKGGLRFYPFPNGPVFFRGTVRLRYQNKPGQIITRYVRLQQRQGELGEPLINLRIKAKESKIIQLDFLYPPDSTPPQVLTIVNLDHAYMTVILVQFVSIITLIFTMMWRKHFEN